MNYKSKLASISYRRPMGFLKKNIMNGRHSMIFLLVVIAPNVLLLSGVFQLFPPIGWVDPGIYTGYFLEFQQRIGRFGPNYFSMRLPFTVVGFAIHSVFSPELATKALAVFFNSLAAFSLFSLVAMRAGLVAGVVASWALTFNPLWVATVSRTYVDGPAMSYALTALALIFARQSGRPRVIMLFVGGMIGAAAIYTHPIMILPLGLALASDALVTRPRVRVMFEDIAWIASGAIAATVLLGLLSLILGGKFLFFLADPHAFERTFQGFGANYQYPLSSWIPGAYRLLPVATLLAFAVILLTRLKRTHPAYGLAAIGLAIAGGVGIFLLFLDFIIGGATLQSSFYSSYLIMGTAIIVGAAATLTFGQDNFRPPYLLFFTIGLLIVAIAVFGSAEPIWAWADKHGTLIWIALLASMIAALAFIIYAPSRVSASPFFLSLLSKKSGFSLLAAVIIACGLLNKDTRRIFITPSGTDYVTSYRSTLKVVNFVNESVSGADRLFFWYDRDELTAADRSRGFYGVYELRFLQTYFFLNYWDSLTAVWLWDRSSFGWTLPALQPGELEKLAANDIPAAIVTFCLDVKKCERASTVISDHGYRVTEAGRRHIDDTGYTAFWAVIYKVEKATPASSPGSHPPG